MRIKSKFVDADGEREMDKFVPANSEGAEIIEDIWVTSFRDMLVNALKEGDDVEIFVKRIPNHSGDYAS